MPLSEYFHGAGERVMGDMNKRYGAQKGKSVFYATAQKRGLKPMWAGDVVAPDEELDELGNPIRRIPQLPQPMAAPDAGPPALDSAPPPELQQGPPVPRETVQDMPPAPMPLPMPPRPDTMPDLQQGSRSMSPAPAPNPNDGPPPIHPSAEAMNRLEQQEDAPEGMVAGQQGPPQLPRTQALFGAVDQALAKKGPPVWRQALGAALSVSPRLRGVGELVSGDVGRQREMERLKLHQYGANEEQEQAQRQQQNEIALRAQKTRETVGESTVNRNRAQTTRAERPATVAPVQYDTTKELGVVDASDPTGFRTLRKATPATVKPPTPARTIEGRALEITDDQKLTPEEKKARLDELVKTHNLFNPEKPITHFATDRNGNVTAVSIKPGQVANAPGGKMPMGQIGKPTQQPPVSRDAINDAIEAAAQSLARGDMSRMRDISGLRGDQRLLLFKRTRELNPHFSTGEIERKLKMEDAFTNGKDGQSLQSFGTFLEHGGAASEAINWIWATNSRLANRPINWWRQNMSGSPEYQALMVSLEPVRKEFEGFLLGGRALYAEDRKAAEIILSDNSAPSQVQAALKQMGHTAVARYNEMNHRYKRLMKTDIPEPFSAEAIEAAKKIGVTLPSTATGGGTPPPSGSGGGGKVKLQAPDGSISEVSADKVDHYLKLGAKRI